MAKKIYIAATYQNVGKTTVSLGLMSCLRNHYKRIGFIKPIGQRYLIDHGFKVDEDSVLFERVFGVCEPEDIKSLSPIAVERGFTEKYIQGLSREDYAERITKAYDTVARGKDLVIIEGTGHAGVGSVFDLSNATVAKMLGADVILVAPGGVGRPIDEVVLNKALFDRIGVRIAGVVVNKVLPEKFQKVDGLVRQGFERKGIPVIGIMPYQKRLDIPTMREIMEKLSVSVVCGERNLDLPVDRILIGAMEVREALRYVETNTLIIIPADRNDLLLAVIRIQKRSAPSAEKKISGVVLTGDMAPDETVVNQLNALEIPTLSIKTDTYSATKKIFTIVVKIKPEDERKIRIIVDMVNRYVDIDKVVAALK